MKSALLLEDHEPTREMRCSVLLEAFEGIQVETISTVAQPRARMEGRVFDLVLFDISLPDGSGVDVAAELSRREAAHYIVMDDDREPVRRPGLTAEGASARRTGGAVTRHC
ncbi:MAG: response regulator [Candidatus Thiodiazotropha sp.]